MGPGRRARPCAGDARRGPDGWKPDKPVEFVGAAGPGGGTDIFARAVQLAIQNNKLLDQPILVSNKGGGSGAETFVYVKAAAGDAHKLAFGTSNLYTLPMVAKVGVQAHGLPARGRHGVRRVHPLEQGRLAL